MAIPSNNIPDSSFSAVQAITVTPSDVTNLGSVCRGLYIGGAGNVAAVMPDDTVITFSGATAGSVLPIRIKRVNSTNTTATNLVALY